MFLKCCRPATAVASQQPFFQRSIAAGASNGRHGSVLLGAAARLLAATWRSPVHLPDAQAPPLLDRPWQIYNLRLLFCLRAADSLSASMPAALSLTTLPQASASAPGGRPRRACGNQAGRLRSTTRCGYCNPATTGRRSIARRPGRRRQTISDSSIASVSLGQRRNRDFSAHRASMRAS